jgi:hypothetical protein
LQAEEVAAAHRLYIQEAAAAAPADIEVQQLLYQ